MEVLNERSSSRVVRRHDLPYNQGFVRLRSSAREELRRDKPASQYSGLGGRPTVGRVPLEHVIGVRIPASQPIQRQSASQSPYCCRDDAVKWDEMNAKVSVHVTEECRTNVDGAGSK
jgi:hypothetical protein